MLLANLGDIVDAESSRLKSDSELETMRFRQAVYIEFCKSENIPPTLVVIRLVMKESLHASLNSSCWTKILVLQQFADMLRQAILCFVSVTLTSPQIYQTAQTCVQK